MKPMLVVLGLFLIASSASMLLGTPPAGATQYEITFEGLRWETPFAGAEVVTQIPGNVYRFVYDDELHQVTLRTSLQATHVANGAFWLGGETAGGIFTQGESGINRSIFGFRDHGNVATFNQFPLDGPQPLHATFWLTGLPGEPSIPSFDAVAGTVTATRVPELSTLGGIALGAVSVFVWLRTRRTAPR